MKNNRFLRTLFLFLLVLILIGSCYSCDNGKGNLQEQSGGENMNGQPTQESYDSRINDRMIELIQMKSPEDYNMGDVQTIYKSEEYGVVMNDPSKAQQNFLQLNTLIYNAQPNSAITIPEGILYLEATSNGGIIIYEKEHLIIHGNNTLIVNTSYNPRTPKEETIYNLSNVFTIYNSNQITIEGIQIDYLEHTSVDGKIVGFDNDYTYFEVYPEFLTSITSFDKIPVSGNEIPFCVGLYNEEMVGGQEYYLNMSQNILVEKANGVGSIESSDSLFRIKGKYGTTGDFCAIRFTSQSYTTPAFVVGESSNLILRDIRVYSTPASVSIFDEGCENLWVDRMVVDVPEGSKRYFSTNIDTLYVIGMRGRVELTNSTFIGLGDDVMNVHSYLSYVSLVNENTLVIKKSNGSKPDNNWCRVGDTLRFFDSKYNAIGEAKVITWGQGDLTLDCIPQGVDQTCLVQNITYNPLTRISNCHVERGRARAFLIQTSDALIRDCEISNMRLAAIIISPDFDDWHEAGFAENVLIYNNKFKNCCGYAGAGAIVISGCHDGKKIPEIGVVGHLNITLLQNTNNFTTGSRRTGMYSVRACKNFLHD